MTVSKTRMMVASRRRVPTASSRCSCRGSEYSKTRYSISKTRMILMAASDGVCHLASAKSQNGFITFCCWFTFCCGLCSSSSCIKLGGQRIR